MGPELQWLLSWRTPSCPCPGGPVGTRLDLGCPLLWFGKGRALLGKKNCRKRAPTWQVLMACLGPSALSEKSHTWEAC